MSRTFIASCLIGGNFATDRWLTDLIVITEKEEFT